MKINLSNTNLEAAGFAELAKLIAAHNALANRTGKAEHVTRANSLQKIFDENLKEWTARHGVQFKPNASGIGGYMPAGTDLKTIPELVAKIVRDAEATAKGIEPGLLETQVKVSSRKLGIADERTQEQIIQDAVNERVDAILESRVDAEIAKRKKIEELMAQRAELQNESENISDEALAEIRKQAEILAKLEAINAELNEL